VALYNKPTSTNQGQNLNDLAITKISNVLATSKPEYNVMLKNIEDKLPAALKTATNFYKGHSQFMNVTVDVTAMTPLRSIYHVLAEIEQTKLALQEAHIRAMKRDIECRRKEAALLKTTDPFDRELLELELLEFKSGASNSQNYIEGAVRKLNFLINQYESVVQKFNKAEITEEDFELEEKRHHVMTCFKQALCAARSHGGIIDEGNAIYIFELGINGGEAQADVLSYLQMEVDLLSEGKAPTHEMTMQWLEACADKYQDRAAKFVEYRGLQVLDRQSLANVPQLESK
tara:strand:+ start:558 stop:1421 length:864 start_codon:yes stop_codon:yes gene_type:complete